MRAFLNYWCRCARFAAQGSTAFANDWQWVFGIPAVSGVVGYLAAKRGQTTLSTGYPILDGLLTAMGAFLVTWLVSFVVRLFNAPVAMDQDQRSEFDRLKALAGTVRSTSFDVFIEAITDADRNGLGSDHLFRAGITNIENDKTLEAYAVLEDMVPSVGVSPAARLPTMGKLSEDNLTIAPSETAYVLLISHEHRSLWGETEEAGHTKFAAASSHQSAWGKALADRDAGRLKVGTTYTAILAVHAPGAISRRLPFSVKVDSDGNVSVESERIREPASNKDSKHVGR